MIFVRHAKTEQLDYGSTKTDYQRELKPRGYKDSEIIAEKLIKMSVQPDWILSSSAKRAKQTAKHIAKHIDFDPEANRISTFYLRWLYNFRVSFFFGKIR